MYSILISELERENADVACCITRAIDDKGIKFISNFKEKQIFTKEDCLKDFFKDKKMEIASYNKVYKSKIIKNLRFDTNFTNNEDKLFLFDVINNIEKAVLIPKPLYNYVRHKNSLTTREIDDNYIKIIDVNNIIKKRISDNKELEKLAEKEVIISNIIVIRKIILDNKINKYKKEYKKIAKYIKKTKIKFREVEFQYKIDIFLIKYLIFLYPILIKIIFKIFIKS